VVSSGTRSTLIVDDGIPLFLCMLIMMLVFAMMPNPKGLCLRQ
jgi:hypothetical protein